MHDLCNSDIIIYRYLPHGSRKIADCKPLHKKDPADFNTAIIPRMICHDQESLDHTEFKMFSILVPLPNTAWPVLSKIIHPLPYVYDQILLLHSEKRSEDLDWFEQRGSVGVYWWSHAVIARDWFRYAATDPVLTVQCTPKIDFLIYNRAWSGLREYRLKFTEMIVDHGLINSCQMTFNPTDQDQHYHRHQFKNSSFEIVRHDLENWFSPTTADANASADYCSDDYALVWIEVVLETVFDDKKWHLTEKILRPIACGKPFILAATPGSLEYLQSYGFQTFSDCWDESYDTEPDPLVRLQKITKLMKSLTKLSADEKQTIQTKIQTVCEHNRRHFFSQEFFDQVIEEYQTNLDKAMQKVTSGSTNYFEQKLLLSKNHVHSMANTEFAQLAVSWLSERIKVPSQSVPGGSCINSAMRLPSST